MKSSSQVSISERWKSNIYKLILLEFNRDATCSWNRSLKVLNGSRNFRSIFYACDRLDAFTARKIVFDTNLTEGQVLKVVIVILLTVDQIL